MNHFRMELNTVQFLLPVFYCRHRTIGSIRTFYKTFGKVIDIIGMTHPAVDSFSIPSKSMLEVSNVIFTFPYSRCSAFPQFPQAYGSSAAYRSRYPKWNPQLKNFPVTDWSFRIQYRCRASRKNNPFGFFDFIYQ